MRQISGWNRWVLAPFFFSSVLSLSAAEPAATSWAIQPNAEIEKLKQMLADQQRQIDELRQTFGAAW